MKGYDYYGKWRLKSTATAHAINLIHGMQDPSYAKVLKVAGFYQVHVKRRKR